MKTLAELNLTSAQLSELAAILKAEEGARRFWWANPETPSAESYSETYRDGKWVRDDAPQAP